jgi:putative transposase
MELETGLVKDGQMKRAKFTEEQIIGVLWEHEAGAKTADLARKHGVSEATLYNWKAKYGGMDVPEAKRLKQLEDENAKLKKLLAEQMLDAAALRELQAKMVGPAAGPAPPIARALPAPDGVRSAETLIAAG